LAEARRARFEAAVVVISPAKESLRRYLTENDLPIPVEVIVQPEPRGIGDAVLRCWRNEPVGVLLPDDVVLETDHWRKLINLHRQSGSATLCVRPVPIELTSRFGVAECEGDRVVRLIEKPPAGTTASNLAIFGRYVVTEPVVAALAASHADGELELTYGFAAALESEPGVRAVEFGGVIHDCGTPESYESALATFPKTTKQQVVP
jgi:UTP--glucose-1-phosphate uridylyltransferase